MRGGELFQLRFADGKFQPLVLELRHTTATRANQMVMNPVAVCPFVLRRSAELMPDDQMGIHQQDDGIVECSPTHPEVAFILHTVIKCIDVKMSLDGINHVEYSIAFGCLAMPVLLQILGEHLFDRFFDILFHTSSCSAFKVKGFYDNLKV